MPEHDLTTISIGKDTREELEKRKIHPRESMDELIRRLLVLPPRSSEVPSCCSQAPQ